MSYAEERAQVDFERQQLWLERDRMFNQELKRDLDRKRSAIYRLLDSAMPFVIAITAIISGLAVSPHSCCSVAPC
jgi:hypothetical protein